jgi:hypothetical protein
VIMHRSHGMVYKGSCLTSVWLLIVARSMCVHVTPACGLSGATSLPACGTLAAGAFVAAVAPVSGAVEPAAADASAARGTRGVSWCRTSRAKTGGVITTLQCQRKPSTRNCTCVGKGGGAALRGQRPARCDSQSLLLSLTSQHSMIVAVYHSLCCLPACLPACLLLSSPLSSYSQSTRCWLEGRCSQCS